MLSNEWHPGVVWGKVFDVVLAECESTTFAVGDDGRGWRERIDGALHFRTGLREDGVEAEDVCDDASDVLELVAKLGLFGVAASVQGCTNNDGLWVRVAVGHGKSATRVLSGRLPVSSYPLVTEIVGLTTKGSDALDSHKFARERLPEVHAVQVGLETRVCLRDQGLVVGNGEDIAVVKATELLPGRLDISLADNARCLAADHNRLDFVTTGHNTNVTRVDDFGEIGVVLVGSVLGNVAIDGDKVTDSHVSESIATEDVDTEIGQLSTSKTGSVE